MMRKCLALAMALAAFGISTAWAQNASVGDIKIDHAWAPAAAAASNSAAYMRLVDTGTKADELVSASSPMAQKVQLHVFNVENGIYGMHPVTAIAVMPGAAATFLRPGSAHVMLEGLKQPLKSGESFRLSLIFKNAGKVQIDVPVKTPQEAMAQASN
jgi:periplasmic copper chaperone A